MLLWTTEFIFVVTPCWLVVHCGNRLALLVNSHHKASETVSYAEESTTSEAATVCPYAGIAKTKKVYDSTLNSRLRSFSITFEITFLVLPACTGLGAIVQH